MKIYKQKNVYEEALDRFRYLYDEFDEVVVSFSGGKDSTVVLNLALEVAKERGIEKVPVLFIDQECEWQHTIDYMRKIMYRPDVKPYWYQIPMVITNNASTTSRYHYCWNEEEKDDWMHPKDPISIKENTYGTDRFHELFTKITKKDFPNKTIYVAGVRTEEAPKRFVALTGGKTYKWITWGKYLDKKKHQYTFYPIYDWSYTDVWKYLQTNNIEYNKVYDEMYRHGVKLNEMRVSNLHHETAIQSLLIVQEIEPKTWNKIAKKIEGANTIKHIERNSFACPKEFPYMFANWEEYARHLVKNLVPDEKYRDLLNEKIDKNEYLHQQTGFWKVVINTVLSSDFDFTKLQNFLMSGSVDTLRRFIFNPQGKDKTKRVWLKNMLKSTDYLTIDQKKELINYFKNNK
jgi:predicted phosphoadenosine phosphosulfate sulfurtransferase